MKYSKVHIISLFFLVFLNFVEADAQIYSGDIILERHEVYDSTNKIWFFDSRILNIFHTLTKEYVIEDELLFEPGERIDPETLAETERNLRATGLFSEARIELDSVGDDIYDVYVVTRDRWSTYPSFLFGTGGGELNIGGRFEELNLLGTGTKILAEGLHRSENDIGWQGAAQFHQRRLFRSEYSLTAQILANRFRTDQLLALHKPYRTLSTTYSYGVQGINSYGSDFLYRSTDTTRLMPFHERRFSAWFSRAWWRKDRIFFSVLTEIDDVDRGDPAYRRAYDNSGKFLLAFSSVAQDYVETSKLNTFQTEDLPVGGWGTAVLGKIFPIGSRGEDLYFVGAQGELSYYDGRLYLFGQMTGASSFKRASGKYTYEEFYGLGFYRLNKSLLLAARFRQQTVWNWNALRQLILDNDAGLRGYDANTFAGDNRIVSNIELRFFPDFKFYTYNFSGALFYDVGSVWNQDVDLVKTRWHNSIGFGIRFHNSKSYGERGIFRIDIAFNLDENKFGGIIFTTDQLFSVFGTHKFNLPRLFGSEFEYE